MTVRAIISDIHANIEALDAVLADMAEKEVEEIIVLGDIVGYGPNPVECLDRLVQLPNIIVKILGNHDEAVLYENAAERFNPKARRAIDWTRNLVASSPARWKLLESMNTFHKEEEFIYVHGSPREPTQEYIFHTDIRNTAKMKDIFARIKHICFVGHTHYPGVYLENCTFTRPQHLEFPNIYFMEGMKAIVNVGSVGQPRDGDTRSSYVTYDTNDDNFVFRRVEYNVHATADKIRRIQYLDPSLAERLLVGK